MLFVCPVCKSKLNKKDNEGGTRVCVMGHSFDRARTGYYNLLLGRGGTHGDNGHMVSARRAFLSCGFYEPLANRVAELAVQYALPLVAKGYPILDAGCGEGYYTWLVYDRLMKELNPTPCPENTDNTKREGEVPCPVFGFDISKDAVKRAACSRRGISFAVAGSYDMPVADGTVGLVMNTFSPLALAETERVITEGGYFLMVIPGEEHLFGLKSKIYDNPYKNRVSDKALSGFSLVYEEELRYPLRLCGEQIKNLFMMTPYAYRTSGEGRARVEALTELTTDAHFLILLYKKERREEQK